MENMRKIGIAAIFIIAAGLGYMAVQRYYAAQEKDVKVQFLNFNDDGYSGRHHGNSYDRGYEAGFAAALRDVERSDGVIVQQHVE